MTQVNSIHSAPDPVTAVSSIQIPRRLVTSAWGGTETTVVQTSRALKRAGHPTRIFTSTRGMYRTFISFTNMNLNMSS